MKPAKKAFFDLVAAEKASVDVVKDRARNVWYIDQATGGTRLKDVQASLVKHGVVMSDSRASRARYIGRLLAALDQENLDPECLESITHEGTLYQLARIHDKGNSVQDALVSIEGLNPEDAETLLKNSLKASTAEHVTTERWLSPLRGKTCPPETAKAINEGFKVFREAGGHTEAAGLLELGALFTEFDEQDWQFVLALADLQSVTRKNFYVIASKLASSQGITNTEAVSLVVTTSIGIGSEWFERLARQVVESV